MVDQMVQTEAESLLERFITGVTKDERQGYSGLLVEANTLLKFATMIKDEYGYDYLSSVTAVDYMPNQMMEVVYHAFKTTGGPALVFKTQAPRDNPTVPSLVPVYPGAEFQEREAWDLMGICFEGHPDLRRILTWEGFAGHPLRKDWKEPLFEEEVKPFKSRWPDGHAHRVEDLNPYNNNVQYPAGFDPEKWIPEAEDLIYEGLKKITEKNSEGLQTDSIIVNLGPQHPSTHGVFRMAVVLEGEKIREIKPVFGYLHRSHEKIGERNTFLQNMPFTDRLDYICSLSSNWGYALAVEKLMGIKPPERAEYIRVMMAELTRFMNHLFATGFLLNDLGAYFTPSLYAIEERELILDIFEEVTGSRMMCNYLRFGGVVRDVTDHAFQKIKELVFERLPRKLDEFDRYLTNNELVRARTEGIGLLTPEQAIGLSASGPLLRASGVPYDIRRADPYGIYDRFDFDVAYGTHGDIYDRYLVRFEEMRQSLRILQQVINGFPKGEVMTGKLTHQVRVPAGESYGRVESPKGELGFYLVSTGKPNPYRYHVRAPTFINLTSLSTMGRGYKVADVVAILGAIDIVLGEVDR